MKTAIFAVFPTLASAWSFSAYDFGFRGFYPTIKYASLSLEPPSVQITKWDGRCDTGGDVVLISPRGIYVPNPGPVILDTHGELVWIESKYGQVMNLQIQAYKGQDFITFWSGTSHGPYSNGSYYILDSSYEIIYMVSAVGLGLFGDLHEFEITSDGTALITIYNNIEVDCSTIGVDGKCWIDDCMFQEIEIETGKLLFQWRASDHVPLLDSYKVRGGDGDGKTPQTAYDFFHINSIDKDASGNYIISSRHMHAIYCISPAGDILWTLGGKHSNFIDLSNGYATNFAWQHHARLHGNNILSLFDNGGNNVFNKFSAFSQGMTVELNTTAMTVRLLHTYIHPSKLLSVSQGSMQIVPSNGYILVGWGNTPAYTEFTPEGEVICDMQFGPSLIFEILDLGWVKSYRAFKSKWIGKPKTPPDIKILSGRAFVSWNGATEIASWVLQETELPTASDEDFTDIEELPKEGFETSFDLDGMADAFVRVVALDASGEALGYTKIVDTKFPSPPWQVSLLEILIFIIGFAGTGFIVWKYKSFFSTYVTRILNLARRTNAQQEYELIGTGHSNEGLLQNGENV